MRYFGFYSSKARGRRATADAAHGTIVEADGTHTSPHHTRRRWAALIKQVWQVDPLLCPRCGTRLKILSFIQPTQADVIQNILKHCGLWQQPSRAPPPDDRAAPREPDPGQLRYVSDLEFVDEPATPEPAWTAH